MKGTNSVIVHAPLCIHSFGMGFSFTLKIAAHTKFMVNDNDKLTAS